MKRILHIVDSMGMGGIQSFIMNVYRNIDRSKIQFDFMLNNHPDNNYDDEIIKLGGKIYYLPARNKGIIRNRRELHKFYKNHSEYDVIHMHESSLTYIEPLSIAKKYHVKTRIIHAHSTKASGNKIHTFLHLLNKRRIYSVATHYFACGNSAKEWMFSNTKAIDFAKNINNGIKISEYKYNDDIRNEEREKLQLDENFVIGHVGRFSKVKNHEFLIDVFNAYHMTHPNSKLVLVGDGELKLEMEKKVHNLKIDKAVLFLGNRKDINKLLQCFDLVIIPSLYEGFPVCAIEAQASGVPCLLSDSITKDAAIKSNVKMLSLAEGVLYWKNQIEHIKSDRIILNDSLYKAGYDIEDTILQLKKVYNLKGN